MFHAAPLPAEQPPSPPAGHTEPRIATEQLLRAIAYHEAGHAVAYVRAAEVIERPMPFERVVIRRDWTEPYVDRRGRSIDCVGLVEASDIYSTVIGGSVEGLSRHSCRPAAPHGVGDRHLAGRALCRGGAPWGSSVRCEPAGVCHPLRMCQIRLRGQRRFSPITGGRCAGGGTGCAGSRTARATW